jgi:putative phosphoesterase
MMIIGVISDTHDDMAAIGMAVSMLNEREVSHVIHAGDFTSPFTFEILDRLRCGFTGIFGNNDGDRLLLCEKSEGKVHRQPYLMSLKGRKIVVVHEPDVVDALSASSHFDLVVYGHIHRPVIQKKRGTLVVNPGKVAKLHKGESTLAIVDLCDLEAEIMMLPE